MPQRFKGVLFLVGRASWKDANGSRGHRIILNRKAVEESIDQLVGLPVWDCNPITKNHMCSIKVGTIDKVFIDGIKVCIEGFMTSDVIPSIQASRNPENLGLSFDSINAHIEDIKSELWEITRLTFKGVTVLPQGKAAFRTDTSFHII